MSFFHQTQKSIHAFLNPVIYLDKRVIVLNKPAGLVCQLKSEDAGGNFNGLLKDLRNSLALEDGPYQVHRLDKGTTGSLILARTSSMARELSQQFQKRTVEKTYLALVRGGAQSFSSTHGQVRSAIQYNDGRASLDPSNLGKPSVTDWELACSSRTAPLSLLRLKLHTGHKHQLRVHLAHCLTAPILGDTLYSSNPTSEAITRIALVPEGRMFLHASEISILRYEPSGRRIRLGVYAPLPADFLKLCHDFKLTVRPIEVKGGLSVDGTFVDDGLVPELNGYWALNEKSVKKA